jgi:uncharacterized protein (DUF1778 family)
MMASGTGNRLAEGKTTVNFVIEGELKDRFREAARLEHMTLTDWLIQAGLKELRRTKRQ